MDNLFFDESEIKRWYEQIEINMPSKELFESITEQSKSLSDSMKLIADSISEKLKLDSAFFQEMADQLKITINELLNNVSVLGQHGWTVPRDSSLNDIYLLLNKNQEETDSFFQKYFTIKRIDNLFIDLLNEPRLTKWHGMLIQIQRSMKRKDYQICMPAAVMVLEGVLAYYLEIGDSQIKGPVKEHEKRIENSIEKIMWLSVSSFIAEFYRNLKFNGLRASFVNRHWIMHGRDDSSLWEKLDIIRILNTVGTIMMVIK